MENLAIPAILLLFCFVKTRALAREVLSKYKNQTMLYNEIPYKEILLLLLGTLSTFLLWRLQHQKDRIKNIESQLSERKYKLYSELIYLIFDVMNSNKLDIKLTQNEILKRILNIKKEMFIYAPDEVFRAFTKWTLELKKADIGVNHFKKYFEVMKLARKDMGQISTKIDLDDFMLFIMQDEEEYKKFKEQNSW